MFNVNKSVERGVALLDADHPGWEAKVSIRSLRIWNVHACILGQVYGSYDRGLRVLDLDGGRQYGFNPPVFHGERTENRWAEVIRERRAAKPERELAHV